MIECKASVEQPRQATEEAFDNAVPEASGAKQTSITDFFSPRATMSSVDVPSSSNTTRSFTLPPFITPCPSVRLAEVSAVFQVSDCVAKDHFDPTRPLSEWGIPKSSVEVSSVETDPLPAQVGSETDTDNEQYWIRQDEDRLQVIREMEKQLVETKAQLANTTTAFQMASDSSKETIAEALKAKEDAESDKKSQQREMEPKIVCLESKIDFLESQLTDRCEAETRLTRTLSRITDFDLWKDIEEEFNTQVSRADTLSEQLEGALSECYEWKETYDELERNHQQLRENHASLEKVLQMVQEMDLEVIRDLHGCLRQVFERMIRCSLLLEDEGYRPFDREHRAICKRVANLTGHDYQKALIDYYKEHEISDEFSLFADDDGTEDEAGGYPINVNGHVRISDYHDQANDEGPAEGLAEVHTHNLGVDTSNFVAESANTVQDSSSAPGRFPQLAHAVAEPESPQISNVVFQSAVDVSEDHTWEDLTVIHNAPYVVDMESYLESIPFRDMDNIYWDDAEFDSRYENLVYDVESFEGEENIATVDSEEDPVRGGQIESPGSESSMNEGGSEDRGSGDQGVSKNNETASSENSGPSGGFAFDFAIPTDSNDPKVKNPFAFGTGKNAPAFVFAASTAASESKSDEQLQYAKSLHTSTPAGVNHNGQDFGEEFSFDTGDNKSFSFDSQSAADLGAFASGKSAFSNPFTKSQRAEAETPNFRYPEVQQDSEATNPPIEGAAGTSNGPTFLEQRPGIYFSFGGDSSPVYSSEASTFFPPRPNGPTSSDMFSSWGQTPPSVDSKEAAENGAAVNEAPKENNVKELAYEVLPDRSRMSTKEVPSVIRLEFQEEPIQEEGEKLKRPNLKAIKVGRMFQEEVPKRDIAKVETPRDHPSTPPLTQNREQEANPIAEPAKKTEKEGNITEPEASKPAQQAVRMRNEEEEEEEEEEDGGGQKESWRLGPIYWDRTALLMPTTRFLDVCRAASVLSLFILCTIYAALHLAL